MLVVVVVVVVVAVGCCCDSKKVNCDVMCEVSVNKKEKEIVQFNYGNSFGQQLLWPHNLVICPIYWLIYISGYELRNRLRFGLQSGWLHCTVQKLFPLHGLRLGL